MQRRSIVAALAVVGLAILGACAASTDVQTTKTDAGTSSPGDNQSGSDAGLQQAPDAGALDPGPDAGTVTETPDRCGTMTQSIGRNLAVTCDSESIDFATGPFYAGYDEDFDLHYFVLGSSDGKYMLELDIYANSRTCPATYAIPFDGDTEINPFDWYLVDAESGALLGYSGDEGSEGTFTIDGYDLVDYQLSYSCSDCVLLGEEADGVTPSCTISGSFRAAAEADE